MATPAIDAAKVIAEIADKLFGRLGVAVLLGAAAFFILPGHLITHIGLDPTSPSQREIAGFLLLISVPTCFVSLLIRAAPSIRHLRQHIGDIGLYWRLSEEAKIILGIMAQAELASVYVPKSYEPGQELIDKGLMYSWDSSGPALNLKRLYRCAAFVRRYRRSLRAYCFTHEETSVAVAKILDQAEKQPRAGWVAY